MNNFKNDNLPKAADSLILLCCMGNPARRSEQSLTTINNSNLKW